ncbi:MAG: S41 family peptidase [Bacteroidota bacterium]
MIRHTSQLLFFLTGFLFATLSIQTQAQSSPLTPLQTDRLTKLSQLWGHVHFFHPYLAYKEVPWDSAFAAIIPKAIAAEDAIEYVGVLQELMGSLDDPASYAELPQEAVSSEPSDREKHPHASFNKDSILIIRVNHYEDLNAWQESIAKFNEIVPMVSHAKGILFDLRAKDAYARTTSWAFDYGMERSGLLYLLTDQTLITPGQRTRMHNGFAPEVGTSSGGYRSSFRVQDGKLIQGRRIAESVPIVFLINQDSYLPPVAVGLQEARLGGIIAVGESSDASLITTTSMDMGEGIFVSFRTSEVLSAKGMAGLRCNQHLPADSDKGTVMETALNFLQKQDFSLQNSTSAPPMVAASSARQYPSGPYPDLGYRVLGAAKTWAVVTYFFAYKELMEADWTQVLKESLAAIVSAEDSLAYTLAILKMYRHLQDGHGFYNSATMRAFLGQAWPPFVTRPIEGQPTITALGVDSVCQQLGLEVGDVLTHIDGKTVEDEFTRIGQYISGSNEGWRRYRVNNYLLLGPHKSTISTSWLGKNNEQKIVDVPRDQAYRSALSSHMSERSGEHIRLLTDKIGYADLEVLEQSEVNSMFERFKDTEAIIFDMRGYPNGTAWTIAPRLTDKPDVPAAYFQRYMALSPNLTADDQLGTAIRYQFYQSIPRPQSWTYTGKTVMLIDERTMSQAEHTGLFFEAANGTEFIGSQTAGANGDVTNFNIPGEMRLYFSGHDVRFPDGRQLQKTGLVPKIEVRPTIQGIRDGRDEVLQRAIEYLETGS